MVRRLIAQHARHAGLPVRYPAAFLVFLLVASACNPARQPPLRLATTTSVKDSGLLDALLPAFKKETGIEVGVVAVGTGLALKLAERGEADAVITHDPRREEAFVAAGHALGRQVFAASDFVIVGPPADPAAIRGVDAVEAFRRLGAANAAFASRGDSSGTHARELLLWEVAGAAGRPSGAPYVEVRAGMATTLQFASDKVAYTLSDRATYLAHQDDLDLAILVEKDPRLANLYAVMVVNPETHPTADARRARMLADWLLSVEARTIIRNLERAGEPLFVIPQGPFGDDVAAQAGLAPSATAQELTVSAGISLKDALQKIARAFEAANPGVTINLNLGASGDLQRQIEAGAPVDVFLSAAAQQMDALSGRGDVDPRTRRDVACNRLVVVVPVKGSRPDPADLSALSGAERIAIGNPRTVPAGQYAKETLEAAGLWADLERRLVYAENVRQALDYVARGEADAGFVYRTDAGIMAHRVRVAFEVDPTLHRPIVYPAAAIATSRYPRVARSFVEFLVSPAATAALNKHGFGLPPCVPVERAR